MASFIYAENDRRRVSYAGPVFFPVSAGVQQMRWPPLFTFFIFSRRTSMFYLYSIFHAQTFSTRAITATRRRFFFSFLLSLRDDSSCAARRAPVPLRFIFTLSGLSGNVSRWRPYPATAPAFLLSCGRRPRGRRRYDVRRKPPDGYDFGSTNKCS